MRRRGRLAEAPPLDSQAWPCLPAPALRRRQHGPVRAPAAGHAARAGTRATATVHGQARRSSAPASTSPTPRRSGELFTGDQSDLRAGEANSFLDARARAALGAGARRARAPAPAQAAAAAVPGLARDRLPRGDPRGGRARGGQLAAGRAPGAARAHARAHVRGDLPRGVRRDRAGRVERLRAALRRGDRHRARSTWSPARCAATSGRSAPAGASSAGCAPPTRCSTRRSRCGAAQPDLDERTDVLSLLLRARDEDGRPMTDAELRDELFTMLGAGPRDHGHRPGVRLRAAAAQPGGAGAPARGDRGGRGRRLPRRRRQGDAAAAAGDRRRRAHADACRARRRLGAAGRRQGLPGDRARAPAARTSTRAPREFRPERFLDEGAESYSWLPVRRRHPPLHRRRARPGRDGRGAPDRRAARSSCGRCAPEPDPVVLRGITLAPKHGVEVEVAERLPAAATPDLVTQRAS